MASLHLLQPQKKLSTSSSYSFRKKYSRMDYGVNKSFKSFRTSYNNDDLESYFGDDQTIFRSSGSIPY